MVGQDRFSRISKLIQPIYSFNQLIGYLRDPLQKNSIFLIGTNASTPAFGFLFWMLAARCYSTSDVGLATAVISAISLIASLAGLGLGVGIVRFLPDEQDKQGMINSCFTIVGLFSLILILCFVGGLNVWSPALLFLREDVIFMTAFILITAVYSLFLFQSRVFIAFRAAKFSFVQSLIAGLRILLIALSVRLGVLGIISSFGIGFCVALMAANLFIWKLYPVYRPGLVIRKEIIRNMIQFSFGNYFADNFRMLTGFVFPIIILHVINPAMSAYFYIAWMIASLLFVIAYSVSSSLLAESSYNPQELRRQVLKAARFIFLIMIPAIILLFFFGELLLSLFGIDYADNALNILRMLTLCSIPLALNELCITVYRAEKKVKPVIYIRTFIGVTSIGGGYLLLRVMGLDGIGIACLAADTIAMLIVVPIMLKVNGISIRELAKALLIEKNSN